MKILHVCETALGGVGTHLNELIPEQIKTLGAQNVRLVAPAEHAVQLSDVPCDAFRTFKRSSRIKGLPHLALMFVRTVRSFKPDVIHVHSTFAGIVVRLLAPLFRGVIIYCPHGWAMDREQSNSSRKFIVFVERALAHLTDHIIAVSQHERQRGIEIGIQSKKIVTVHNGLRPAPQICSPVSWSDTRLKVLFVGRLDRQKGVDILLKAITGLEDAIAVRIIGDAVVSDESICFDQYPHVEHLGWLDAASVCAHMEVCDVVVMPSRWEGLGYVALEAMRKYKPIIASDVGGLTELVEEGITGHLFPVGDHEALAKLLVQSNPEKLAVMGRAGHAFFLQGFTAEKMGNEILDIYNVSYDSTAPVREQAA